MHPQPCGVDPSFSGHLHSSDPGWAEGSINWSNAPGPGALQGTAGPVTAADWIEIALPASLFTASQEYSFVVSGKNSQSEYFVSKEGAAANRPQLILTVTP